MSVENSPIVGIKLCVWSGIQDREAIQEEFCARRVKVVVATVAFGMGLDAIGVRGVIHLTLPRSLEEYVQQVGKARSSNIFLTLTST